MINRLVVWLFVGVLGGGMGVFGFVLQFFSSLIVCADVIYLMLNSQGSSLPS